MTEPRGFHRTTNRGTLPILMASVETRGEVTTGATVFDRRMVPAWRHNMAVAVTIDTQNVLRQIVAALENAGRRAGNVEPGR